MRSKQDIKTNNERVTFAIGALGGVGGSVLTILLVLSVLWAFICLIGGKFKFVITKFDLVAIIPPGVYAFSQICFALINEPTLQHSDGKLIKALVPLFLFFSGWLLIPRLRSRDYDILDYLVMGAGFCSILALPVAFVQVMLHPLGLIMFPMRAEGGAGNALPFSLICTIFGALALCNLNSEPKWRKILAVAGYLASVACILMAASLSFLPVLIVSLIFFFILNRKSFAYKFRISHILLFSLALLILSYPFSIWIGRFHYLMVFIEKPQYGLEFSTFTDRITMWKAAWKLFLDSPFLGHGYQNRAALIFENTKLAYSHFHNAYLSTLVDSGLIGLCVLLICILSPVIICFLAPKDEKSKVRWYVAFVLTLAYFSSGVTNIIFGQDIYDSVFLWLTLLISASLPVSSDNKIVFGNNGSQR